MIGIDASKRTREKKAPRAGEAESRRQESTKGEKHKRSKHQLQTSTSKHRHSNHTEALIKITLIRAACTLAIQPRGQAGGRGHSRVDFREGKLAVAAPHEQGGPGITFRDKHRDDLRSKLHDGTEAIRMPSI
ncbi:MAG: hypothetical protein ACLQT5_06065 [Steroidobacteraceae bacterium]